MSPSSHGEMLLYVTVDTKTWARAQFPHASSARLRENAYTIVESTTHSLAVDVVLQDQSFIGTLFVSNSNGTFFVQSLKDTNRNDMGYVDYERIYGVEGVGLANSVSNAQEVEGRNAVKKLKTYITFDDGSNWSLVPAPSEDSEGRKVSCNTSDKDKCSLHLHSVTTPRNYGRVFSSPAPGLVMGVGSIGENLLAYEECDTFLSIDAGLTWRMVKMNAHKHQIGGAGSVLVVVNDEDGVDEISYSLDFGKTWLVVLVITYDCIRSYLLWHVGKRTNLAWNCALGGWLLYLTRHLWRWCFSERWPGRIGRVISIEWLLFNSILRMCSRRSVERVISLNGMLGVRVPSVWWVTR